MWMWLALAVAGPPELGVAGSWLANEPYVFRGGVELTLGLWPHRRVGVELGAGASPQLGRRAGWQPLTTQLVTRNRITPAVHRSVRHLWTALALTVAEGDIGGRRSARWIGVDLTTELGLVRTVEDAWLFELNNLVENRAWLTADQQHVYHAPGLRARVVVAPRLTLELHTKVRAFIEVERLADLAIVRQHWLGLGLRWALRGPPSAMLTAEEVR